MLGVRSAQRGRLEADHLYLDYVGRGSFYGFLASMLGQLFRDEEFSELYFPDNGRDSVPPCPSGPKLEVLRRMAVEATLDGVGIARRRTRPPQCQFVACLGFNRHAS